MHMSISLIYLPLSKHVIRNVIPILLLLLLLRLSDPLSRKRAEKATSLLPLPAGAAPPPGYIFSAKSHAHITIHSFTASGEPLPT